MHISLQIDRDGRWTWHLRDARGEVVAVSTLFFETDSLAVDNALQTCRQLTDAPIYMSRGEHAGGTASHIDVERPASYDPARLAEFARRLDADGLDAAVEFLNLGIVHRYTAVYRLNDKVLENIVMIDKLRQVLPANLANVPYSQSFCQFAIREGYFRTENSAWDERLDGHPAQGVMNSYHAFPLVTATGDVFGTVCHFDTDALALDDPNFELLRAAAKVIASRISPSMSEVLRRP